MAGKLRVTRIHSPIGRKKDQKATLITLGLRRNHQTVVVPDTPAFRGRIEKVRHLVVVEPIADGEE